MKLEERTPTSPEPPVADEPSDRLDRAVDGEWMTRIGRAGWVAKGIVYGLVGILAAQIALASRSATGSQGDEASRSGAIAEIAQRTWGSALLVVLATGLALYSLWRLVTALMPGDDSDAGTWAHRLAYLGSAALYAFLAWSALSFAFADSAGSSSGDSHLEQLSRWMLGSTGGRWLLGIGALVGYGVAVYFGHKAVQRSFRDQLDLSGAKRSERKMIDRLGLMGWVGRSLTVALLATFVLHSAWTADADEAEGLDGALRRVADGGPGTVFVLVVAAALVAYGLFAALSARHRRLVGP